MASWSGAHEALALREIQGTFGLHLPSQGPYVLQQPLDRLGAAPVSASVYPIDNGYYTQSETRMVETTNPKIRCTRLPEHWRANKSLPERWVATEKPQLYPLRVSPSTFSPHTVYANGVLFLCFLCSFCVFSTEPIPNGTECEVTAGNEGVACAELKNSVAVFQGNSAKFNDLRFVGKSGRGRCPIDACARALLCVLICIVGFFRASL